MFLDWTSGLDIEAIPEDLALYQDQPEEQQHFLGEITAMDRAMGQLRDEMRALGIADNTLLWYTSDNGAIPKGSTGGLRGRKGATSQRREHPPMLTRSVAGTETFLPDARDRPADRRACSPPEREENRSP